MCDTELGTGSKRLGNKSLCHCWRMSKNNNSVPEKRQKKEKKILSIIVKGTEKKKEHVFL